MFRETVTVYCDKHTRRLNTLCGRTDDMLKMKERGPLLNQICTHSWKDGAN